MNFAPYQNRESLNAPASQVSNVRYTNAGEQALARADGVMGAAVADGFLKLKDTVEQGKALEANNEYNQRMSQGTTELMQLKEQEALDITDQYDQLRKKTMDDIQKKYGTYLTYGAGAAAFREYTMRDDATRRANVMKYQHAQTEAYRTTQTNNALAVCAQQAADSGYTDEGIDGAIERALPIVGFQFANYGDEKIKEQQRLIAGKLVDDAVQFAVRSDDYKRIDGLCNKYASVMDPKARASLLAMVRDRAQKANDLSKWQQAYVDLGPNATAAQMRQWLEERLLDSGKVSVIHDLYEKTKGAKYVLGAPEDGADGTFDCGSWSKYVCGKAGLNLASRCADDQYDQMIAEGRAFHEKSHLRDGDLVFWTNTGGEEGENGVSHVGIYDGETGKVMQAGVHGVGEIDLDTYDTVGFGRGVGDEKMSALGLEENLKKMAGYFDEQRSLQRGAENRAIEDGTLAIKELANKGVTDMSAYEGIPSQYGMIDGVMNDRVRIELESQISSLQRRQEREARGRAGRSGGNRPADGFEGVPFSVELRELLSDGAFDSYSQAAKYINDYAPKENDWKSGYEILERWKNGEGEFGIDWKSIKTSVQALAGGYNKDTFDASYALAKDATLPEIREYQKTHDGDVPPQQRIIDTMAAKLANITISTTTTKPGWLWDSEEKEETMTSKAALYSKGVESMEDNGDGTYSVTLIRDGGTYRVSQAKAYEIANSNETARDILLRGE